MAPDTKVGMESRAEACALLALALLLACVQQGEAQAYRYYYNNRDLVLVGRCTCKDTDGSSIAFNVCTPTRGGIYNQCSGCGLGNILPKCQGAARARGLTDVCTDYTELGCAVDCDSNGCRPNSCFRGSCTAAARQLRCLYSAAAA
ncbi:g4212 [Coccomyxa elongata]